MIETAVESYLVGIAKEAFGITEEQIIVRFPSTSFDFKTSYRKGAIGQETLSAEVIVASDERLDRIPFIRAIKRSEIELDNVRMLQEYKGSRLDEYVDAAGHKVTVFNVEFIYDVWV